MPTNLRFESIYLLKKQRQNPMGSFKDLSIHRDRQRKRLCFILYYDYEDNQRFTETKKIMFCNQDLSYITLRLFYGTLLYYYFKIVRHRKY
jgi:hypothetical protein